MRLKEDMEFDAPLTERDNSVKEFVLSQLENRQVALPPVKILVIGNDRMFSKFAKDFLVLVDQDSKHLDEEHEPHFCLDHENVDLRVYYIPQGCSTLGHYIAMHDDFYC